MRSQTQSPPRNIGPLTSPRMPIGPETGARPGKTAPAQGAVRGVERATKPGTPREIDIAADTLTGTKLHPAVGLYAAECRAGALSRREFLTRASALGASTAAAYALIGLAAPAKAQAVPKSGGTLRIQMETKALKDPRTFDWSQLANFTRGWLEYLVEYNNDGSFTPMLLEGWETNDHATEYLLKLRPGVTWSNGDAFSAEDVAFNLRRWCRAGDADNSMASRMAPLIDAATGMAAEGAITVLDPLTLRLLLNAPDITLIPGFADYPAAILHPSYDGGDPSVNPIGTGPYLPEVNEVGVRQVLVRRDGWWGQGGYLDRIEFIDYGTDDSAFVEAAQAGEVDMLYQSVGEFIDALDAIGWERSEAVTAATIAVRFNQKTDLYKDLRVRKALQLAVDNAVVLELGYDNRGTPAENHHVCPIHPEYAPLAPLVVDPALARQMIVEAGHGDTEFELFSIDDNWQANTCNTVASQIRDAGIQIKRTILPSPVFSQNWASYPFSGTEWNMRPLGVQIMALAYRGGAAWNETGFNNPEFDALLAEAMSIADAEKRRRVMARLETILQDEGVVIQPYWRSIFRHVRPGVKGAEMHATFEMHLYKYWIDA